MARFQTAIQRADRAMYLAMCGLIYFIPISSALVEWMFGIGLLSYILKRSFMYRQTLDAMSEEERATLKSERLRLWISHFKPVESRIYKAIMVYCVIVLLSTVFSMYPINSLQAFVFKTLQSFLTIMIFTEAVSSKKRLKRFLFVWLFSIALININGLYQYSSGTGFIRMKDMYWGRVKSSFAHPNDFASYLIGLIPILFSLSFLQFFQKRQKSTVILNQADDTAELGAPLGMLAVFLLFLYSIFSLGVTYSRGGWLACFFSLFLLLMRKPKLLAMCVVPGLIFIGLFTFKMLHERTMNISGSLHNILFNYSDREGNWLAALQIIKDHPIFGVGLNNYTYAIHTYEVKRAEYPHNCFLQLTAELGIPALISFCWIFVTLFREGLGQLKQLHERWTYHCLAGGMAGLVAFLIQGFFDTSFYSTQLSAYMWLLVGFIIAVPRVERKARAEAAQS